jgi:hypothetical protein
VILHELLRRWRDAWLNDLLHKALAGSGYFGVAARTG